MYQLTVLKSDTVYTIPKGNIGLLAFTKARDMGAVINPRDAKNAIKFLESIGIKVEEKEND
jgi:hypothetical protein